MSIYRLRATPDNPIVTPCARPAVEAPSSMISSSTLNLQPSRGSPPHHWDDLRQWLRGVIHVLKIFEHAFDSSSNFWPSKSRGKLVATSSADPFLVAKTLTIATRATHYCLDDFCIDQDSVRPLQNTHRQARPWLPLTPIWESDSLQCPFPKGHLLQTIRRFFNPLHSSSLFNSFSRRASHWFYGLQVTENRYSTDALVHARSDKYPKTSSHRGVTSDDSMCIEVSTPYFQQEKTCNVVLNLDSSSQALNPSGQLGPSCSQCSSFVRQNREDPCIHGPCTTFEDANYILQVVGLNGHEKTIRNCLHKFKGNGEPGDNAGSIKRVEDVSSRAPADGEASQKPPKRQRHNDHQSSHYDEGTDGPAKAFKKRKQESREKEEVDSDEFGEASGKIKNGRKRNEEEESGRRKFACPFYKYDRQAFMSSRTCVGPGWDSVHRVKEHIFRRHMLSSTQCENCLEQFETRPVLDEHRQNPCRKKPPSGSYGINKEQEKQLRSRKMYQKSLDEEEKWRAIYKIIFPGEKNIPSPYYEPEVPEFPDIYQQMLIEELPEIVTRRLTALDSGLVEHIKANAMANRQGSTEQDGRKPNEGLDLMGSTQASVGSQLEQHIQDAVKAAVKEMLSQVPVSKEPNTGPQINVKSPKEEPNGWMKKEEQAQFEKPTQLESNLLQLPGMVGTELKLDTQTLYPTPRSLTFSRSPEVPLAAVEQNLPNPTFLEQAPQETGFYSLFNENHSGNVLEHIPGVSSFPELDSLASNTWENLGDNSTSLTVPVYTSAGPNLSLNASGPASHQSQELLSAQGPEPESFALGPWEFSPAPAIQSVDSGYGTIIGPPTSNSFEDWGDLDDQFTESFI
ncbi:hypothetical protein NCS57_00313300 [Fusarium keratoplasticum]|uniref:Uncharacterized protein n=1 Tax=Fusarium keratoplasticum TaxID=1328300 RepID=A0ACC0RAJ4_9HYPO|nr:hypothetical protein NCS57_00313300 [Fusarium keratoplasticum]KAI8680329.1 hypothetical protein NCS57_00313300 [Fusarium keratoplasticum]